MTAAPPPISESTCRLAGDRLAGIVTAAATSSTSARGACVLVNAGLVPKHGPFRLYTELARRLARAGYTTLASTSAASATARRARRTRRSPSAACPRNRRGGRPPRGGRRGDRRGRRRRAVQRRRGRVPVRRVRPARVGRRARRSVRVSHAGLVPARLRATRDRQGAEGRGRVRAAAGRAARHAARRLPVPAAQRVGAHPGDARRAWHARPLRLHRWQRRQVQPRGPARGDVPGRRLRRPRHGRPPPAIEHTQLLGRTGSCSSRRSARGSRRGKTRGRPTSTSSMRCGPRAAAARPARAPSRASTRRSCSPRR